MKFIDRMLDKVANRVLELSVEREKERRKQLLSSCALIKPSSAFLDEAEITNAQNDKTKISVGDHTFLRCELIVFGHGGQIEIGDYCYIGSHTRIWSAKRIKIGNRVLIAHNVNIHDNISHPIDPVLRHEHFKNIINTGHPTSGLDLNEKEVVIGDDVWIGFNVTILKGVTIGNGAVIGACSLVTKDVQPMTVVAGNPAVELKKI